MTEEKQKRVTVAATVAAVVLLFVVLVVLLFQIVYISVKKNEIRKIDEGLRTAKTSWNSINNAGLSSRRREP